jgi:hypothetical protein
MTQKVAQKLYFAWCMARIPAPKATLSLESKLARKCSGSLFLGGGGPVPSSIAHPWQMNGWPNVFSGNARLTNTETLVLMAGQMLCRVQTRRALRTPGLLWTSHAKGPLQLIDTSFTRTAAQSRMAETAKNPA